MTDPKTRRAPIEVLESLAKAVDIWLHCNPKLITSACTKEALAAYRAATAPLRTRAEVDAEIAATVRKDRRCARGLSYANSTMVALDNLCSEPTRDEPEESHQERHKRMNVAGMAKIAEILGKKTRADWSGSDEPEPNATTDHDADLREPEACSCEESEGLKREVERLKTLTESGTAPNTLEWRKMVDKLRQDVFDERTKLANIRTEFNLWYHGKKYADRALYDIRDLL